MTSLEDGSDGGEVFASERSLQGDLGGIVLSVLPELRALNFRSHGVEDKHRICLHVGACEDVKSRFEARGLLIFRMNRKTTFSRPASFVRSQTITDAEESRLDISVSGKRNPARELDHLRQ
jgi:hypothetical protein